MFRNGSRCAQAVDVFGAGVHRLLEGIHIGPVPKGLNAAGRGAGANSD